ncbi:MAG: hypothetical protein JWN94_1625 [Betaproteobacteria bacterium]|nr:hypothetical protein [Betaproteobacteria bacterium]
MTTKLKNQVRALIGGLLMCVAGGALAENYEPGQVWSYKTRPQEKDSTLMVLRIDNTTKLGQVIFIGLKELRVRHPNGNVIATMSPLPFTKEALDKSVVKIIGKSDDLMKFSFGYQQWKQAQFQGKKPPTYVKTVAEIVDALENGYIGIPQKK